MALNPKITDAGDKVKMTWTPDAGQGYRFYVDGKAVSRTFKAEASETEFLKPDDQPHSYGIARMDVLPPIEAVTFPAPPVPPDPPPGNIPSNGIITAGGTYKGSRTGVLQIRTDQPVIIEDSVITNLGTGFVIDATQVGLQLTVRRTKIIGGSGQAIRARQYKSVTVQNCDIEKTWGIRLDACLDGASVLIEKCKFRNQVFDQPSNGNGFWWAHSIQFADGGARHARAEVSWCQFENEYGNSWVEDVISYYRTGKGYAHDCGIRGAYPPPGYTGAYSGGGIMAGDNGGGDTLIKDCIVVGTMNYCFGILGGSNSRIRNNRGVNDSRTDAGVAIRQASGGLGIQIFKNDTSSIPFNNNVASDNWIGVVKENGAHNDYWVGAGGTGNKVEGHKQIDPVNKQAEDAEWQRWLDKVKAAGVKIGV